MRQPLEPISPIFAPITAERARRYETESKAYYRQAQQVESEGDRERAISLYKAAWERSGHRMTEAANNAGVLRFELRDWRRARASFVVALKACPTNAVAWYNLGAMQQLFREEALAKQSFIKAVEMGDYRGLARSQLSRMR